MVGFVSAISLLLRHWGAIERYTQVVSHEDLTTPLLQVCMFTRACMHAPSCWHDSTASFLPAYLLAQICLLTCYWPACPGLPA